MGPKQSVAHNPTAQDHSQQRVANRHRQPHPPRAWSAYRMYAAQASTPASVCLHTRKNRNDQSPAGHISQHSSSRKGSTAWSCCGRPTQPDADVHARQPGFIPRIFPRNVAATNYESLKLLETGAGTQMCVNHPRATVGTAVLQSSKETYIHKRCDTPACKALRTHIEQGWQVLFGKHS